MTILLSLVFAAWTMGDLAGAPEAHSVNPASWTVAALAGAPSQAVREVAKPDPVPVKVATRIVEQPKSGASWNSNRSSLPTHWTPPKPKVVQPDRRWHDILEFPGWQAWGFIDSGGKITPERWRQKAVAAPVPQQQWSYRWAMPTACGPRGCR